jgi:hypothetical protein
MQFDIRSSILFQRHYMSDLLAVGSLVGQARTGKALLRNRTVLEILRRLGLSQLPACMRDMCRL